MSRPWVRMLWWVCLVVFMGTAAFGGRLEDATGLPVGPGSWLLLLVFAAYRAIDWYVFRLEHPEDELEQEGSPPQTVEMALQRVAAKRAGSADVAGAPAEPGDSQPPSARVHP